MASSKNLGGSDCIGFWASNVLIIEKAPDGSDAGVVTIAGTADGGTLERTGFDWKNAGFIVGQLVMIGGLEPKAWRLMNISGVSTRVDVLYRLQWYESTRIRLSSSVCSAPCPNANLLRFKPSATRTLSCAIRPSAKITRTDFSSASSVAR